MSKDLELIVIYSEYTDRNPEVVKEFSQKESRVRLILEIERRGEALALNNIIGDCRYFTTKSLIWTVILTLAVFIVDETVIVASL